MQTRIVFIGKNFVTVEKFGGAVEVALPISQFKKTLRLNQVVDLIWSIAENCWIVETHFA